MRPLLTLATLAVTLSPSCLLAQKPTPKPAAKAPTGKPEETLPVRQVVLYKNGIGYFEHLGSVTGNQRVAIDFTSSQLNDVLQSLTILDDNGGRIAGVNYNSTTPLAEQLKSLSLGMSEDPTSTDLFQALRGQRVEVSGVTGAPGGSITGRLMSIEGRIGTEAGDSSRQTSTRYYLTLIANTGAARVIELTPALSVRPLDASLQSQLDRYLELLSTNHATGLRHLTLDALGQGPRQLHVSYISEVPVWKSTYRIVFPREAGQSVSTENAILQGWAVVDNTIGSDWDNVQLSLVAGAPQSFIQPLSQPLYIRRPEIPISTTAQTTPQTHEAADMPEEKAVDEDSSAKRKMPRSLMMASPAASQSVTVNAEAISGLASISGGVVAAGYGPGSGGNTGGGLYRPSDAIQQGDVATNHFDDFFEYSLTQPVTIHKNQSAMVPILQESLPAERVTLWSQSETVPFRAIWLLNNSRLTLDSGSFSIFESGVFGGQGLLDPIHPGERRLLSYAADQAIHVRQQPEPGKRVIRMVHITPRGIIHKEYGAQSKTTYVASNSADTARTVVLEVPRRADRTLAQENKPAETANTLYRFRLPVPAHQSASLLVADEGIDYENWQINEDADQVGALESLGEEVPAIEDKIKPIYMAQHAINQRKAKLRELDQKLASLAQDEARARENLTALKGNDGAKRFVDQLNKTEDDLEATRKQAADLKDQEKAAVEALKVTLSTLEISWSSKD